MISKVALFLILLLRILTIIILLSLDLVVFRGIFREKLLLCFLSKTCLHNLSFAMNVLLLFCLRCLSRAANIILRVSALSRSHRSCEFRKRIGRLIRQFLKLRIWQFFSSLVTQKKQRHCVQCCLGNPVIPSIFAFIPLLRGNCDTFETLVSVETLVSDHLGNSKKWSWLQLVAYKNKLS